MNVWLAQWPAFLVASAVLFVPGLLIGWALRLRGLVWWALAPAISVGVLASAALVLGLFGLPWRPAGAVAATVFAVGAGLAARYALSVPAAPTAAAPRGHVLLALGLAAGVLLTSLRLGLYIGAPDAISQTNDASFHLNALRFAVETGAASPLELTSMIGAESFYPSAWHVFASLVVQLTGTSVEVAANATSLSFAGLSWPVGIALLARAVGGTIAAAVAAATASAIPAFPLLMMQWGILYPQLVAGALLPSAIAVVVLAARLADARRAPWLRPALLVVIALVAILFSQPSVILAWAVAAWSYLLWEAVRRWRDWSRKARRIALAALLLSAVAVAALWVFFGRSIDGTWPASTGIRTALLEIAVNGFLGYPWAVGVSILAVIGIVHAVRVARLRWLATTWAAFACLYVVAAAVSLSVVRALLVDPWYDDPYRLAALLPVVVLPLAGLGAALVVRWSSRVLGYRARFGGIVAVAAVAVTGAISLAVAPEIQRRDVFTHEIDANLYRTSADSFLSTDELALLRRLDRTVPADAVVIGNPSTGMSFGYAVSGRNVVPRTWSPPPTAAYAVLWESLRDVASDPDVCPALDAYGARYVLDFGIGEEYPGRWLMPGFDDLARQPGFELVDHEGAASLWRVTACD